MRNRDVAALWARQARPRAAGSNLSFFGPVLKSYSTAIAELVALPDGRRVAVLNWTDYSRSTSRHAGHASFALRVPTADVFEVPLGTPRLVPDEGPRRLAWAQEQIKISLEKAAEARAKAVKARRPHTQDWHERRSDELKANAKRLAEWFMVYDNEEPDSVRQEGELCSG